MSCLQISQQDNPNAFAPLELDPLRKGAEVTIDHSRPLLLSYTGGQPVLGKRGIEVESNSGRKGYFEVHCIKGLQEQTGDGSWWDRKIAIAIGLATCSVDLTLGLGYGFDGLVWESCLGEVGGEDEDDDDEMYGYVSVHQRCCLRNIFRGKGFLAELSMKCDLTGLPAFTEGDTIGMMVDCSGPSKLLFFVNGVMLHEEVMTSQMEGIVIFPAFQVDVYCGEMEISPNPCLPVTL